MGVGLQATCEDSVCGGLGRSEGPDPGRGRAGAVAEAEEGGVRAWEAQARDGEGGGIRASCIP